MTYLNTLVLVVFLKKNVRNSQRFIHATAQSILKWLKSMFRAEPSALHLCARGFFSLQSRKIAVCNDLSVNFLGKLNLDLTDGLGHFFATS